MRELPILFSAPMVRAILEGRKTVTRRVVKPTFQSIEERDDGKPWPWREDLDRAQDYWYPCPYGEVGDRLWVREAWRAPAELDDRSGKQIADACLGAGYRAPWCPIRYEADGALNSAKDWREFGSTPGEAVAGRYRHARFMPRWASRITLEVTDVRVERLQDITEEQAEAEGAPFELHAMDSLRLGARSSHRAGFERLWESINGANSWADNPWVWVVKFRRIEASKDAR